MLSLALVMKKLSYIILLVLCLSGSHLRAQNITIQFSKNELSSILTALDEGSPYRIYFKESQIPKTKLSGSFSDAKIDDILRQLLQSTPLTFWYYDKKNIIVLPKEFISKEFSADYYTAIEKATRTSTKKTSHKNRAIVIGQLENLAPSGKATINGRVINKRNKKPIDFATVYVEELELGITTDDNGAFQLKIAPGKYTFSVNFLGYTPYKKKVTIFSDGDLEIKMKKGAVELTTVVVGADAVDVNVGNTQVGRTRIEIATLKKTPTFLGSYDLVKNLLLAPGVSSVGEGTSGFNVRGGEIDQNLILQDGGIIFNTAHALGLFSAFNPDLLGSVILYKGNVPAQYGGRLSAVLDVKMKEGNFQKYNFKGSFGPIASNFKLEGPLAKKKSSFLIGARASYTKWLLRALKIPELDQSSTLFYDVNFRFTQKLKKKNSLTLMGYSSADNFRFQDEFGFDYQTIMGQLIYKNIFSNKLFSKLSLVANQYSSTQYDYQGFDASSLESSISHFKIKELLTYSPSKSNKWEMGLSSILYRVSPGNLAPNGEESVLLPKTLANEKGVENAAFVSVEKTLSPALTISAGLRLSLYLNLGPKTVFDYEPGAPILVNNIIDTLYQTGILATYLGVEPRLSARYKLTPTSSIKAGYSRMSQFLNQLYNSDSPTPTSQYQLSTQLIKPFKSHNFSVGYFRNLEDNNWVTSAEFYFRYIDRLYDYRDFAEISVNEHIETELLEGKGNAFGLELSIQKKVGTWNGRLSYTLSKSSKQIPEISNGQPYPSNFDRPHDFSLLLNYSYNNRHTFTFNVVYQTGRPVTAPLTNFLTPNHLIVPIYSNRNEFRIPNYQRIDFAYTIGQGYKKDRKFKTSWTFSIYNILGRKNAYSVFFKQSPFTGTQAYKFSVLGSIFPSITFNLEML